EVFPVGLYDILMQVHKNYGFKALYITENGAAFEDKLDEKGQVNDDRRQAFIEAHFEQAGRAIRDGVPLKGYFVWSLMDNFEWSMGYTLRFGMVYVDYATQKR